MELPEDVQKLYTRTLETIKRRAREVSVDGKDRPSLYKQANAAWKKYEENSARGHWIKACYCLHVYTKICLDFSLHRMPKSHAAGEGAAANSLQKLVETTLERLKTVEGGVKMCNRGVLLQLQKQKHQKELEKKRSEKVGEPLNEVPSAVLKQGLGEVRYSVGDSVVHTRSSDKFERFATVVQVHTEDAANGLFYTIRTSDGHEIQTTASRLSRGI